MARPNRQRGAEVMGTCICPYCVEKRRIGLRQYTVGTKKQMYYHVQIPHGPRGTQLARFIHNIIMSFWWLIRAQNLLDGGANK